MAKIKFWCIMAMLSIMVIDLTGHCITVRRDLLHKREEKEERYRDIEPLVHYVGALIGGYVFVQDAGWPLSMYDQSDDVMSSYAKMAEEQSAAEGGDPFEGVRMGIKVLRCEHDGQRGWARVDLWSVYYPDGSLGEAHGRALWFIEKEGLQWKIRYIDDGSKGRRWLWK